MEQWGDDGSAGTRAPAHLGPWGQIDDPSPRHEGERTVQWLHRTIETEIVPRLMLAHRAGSVTVPAPIRTECEALSAEDVVAFCELVLRDDVDACDGFVRALRERGVALEDIYLDLLGPAARRLGLLWETDCCDFGQVTLGLWRLQSLVFDLSPQLPDLWADRPHGSRRVMLAATPGSQHTFGLLMVAEFFRRAGWDVWSDPSASQADLVSTARSEWFDLVGLSIGSDTHVGRLESVILALRRASRNPLVGVMVGGPIAAHRSDLVAAVGADFTAADARGAVESAQAFLDRRKAAA